MRALSVAVALCVVVLSFNTIQARADEIPQRIELMAYWGGVVNAYNHTLHIPVSTNASNAIVVLAHTCFDNDVKSMPINDDAGNSYALLESVATPYFTSNCLDNAWVSTNAMATTAINITSTGTATDKEWFIFGFVQEYKNVSGVGNYSVQLKYNPGSGYVNKMKTIYANSWVASLGVDDGCQPASDGGTTGSGSMVTRTKKATYSPLTACSAMGDSNGNYSIPTWFQVLWSFYSNPGYLFSNFVELRAATITTFVINGIDIFGIAALVIFFALLCAGVWGSAKIKHWRGG